MASATYVKTKEVKVGSGGEYRIKFSIKVLVATTVYGKIYRNGIAVGTERSTGSGSYVEFSEDISGWASGDLIQVYIYGSSPDNVAVSNLRLYVSAPLTCGSLDGY